MSLKKVGHVKDKTFLSFFKLQDLVFMLLPLYLTYHRHDYVEQHTVDHSAPIGQVGYS